jgi:hypothetical protein
MKLDDQTPEPEPPSSGPIPFRNFIPEPPERANAPDRLQLSSEVLYPILLAHRDAVDSLRQLRLRGESDFIGWARKLKLEAWSGYPMGDAEKLWLKGWLRADEAVLRHRKESSRVKPALEVTTLGQPLNVPQKPAENSYRYDLRFHPFRLLPFSELLDMMDWRLSRMSIFYGDGVVEYAREHVERFESWIKVPRFLERLNWWNGIADLALLLEPIYWPSITGRTSGSLMIKAREDPDSAEASQLRKYKDMALAVLERIPKATVATAHMELRHEAAKLDDNHELYLILRATNWQKRERIEGQLGCAMWLRHIAEVLRHGYDELYEDRLVHEDEAFGMWYEGARNWVYGSEYPLENISEMTRRILPHWGIASSPRVRFYVEGETEEGALEAGLEGYLGFGVEVVNLRAQGWGTWLRQELENDVAAKRLSILMLDDDQVEGLSETEVRSRQDSIRALKAHARDGLITGMVFVNSPDLELGCFTIEELSKAITYYEEASGIPDLEPLDTSQFTGVRGGREFEERYCKLRMAPSLKGKAWGASLMRVAFESRRGESNPLMHAWACAARAVTTDYEVQKTRSPIDPETLKNLDVKREMFP